LLFDEPLSNLDAKLRVQMREELSRLQRQLGITTVYVTHDQEEAMAISDRIAVMQAGRVAQVGTARDLYRAPRSVFVAQFIGRVNLLPARVVRAGPGATTVTLWRREVTVPVDGAGAIGADVSLVLRPESVGLLAAGAAAPAGEIAVDGVVRSRTFLGEKVEYTVEVDGTSLLTVAYDPLRHGLFESGARVQVICAPASLRLLSEA
jgi:iron(III) transport system ATP-binding protein